MDEFSEPCTPFTECWCEQHPNNPKCANTVSVDNSYYAIGIVVLIIILMFKKFKNGYNTVFW